MKESHDRGISFLSSALVFHILPTTVEIGFVSGILAYQYGPSFAIATVTTMGAYTAFTLAITSWRTKFRREMNSADNNAAAKSVDSLLNFEAVKYFGNEKFETKQYDRYLQQYEVAGIKNPQSLGGLKVGENAVFSVALTGMMWLAVNGIAEGNAIVNSKKGEIAEHRDQVLTLLVIL